MLNQIFYFSLALLMCTPVAYAAEDFGSVEAISGTAFIADATGRHFNIQQGQVIHTGETIHTEKDSELQIESIDGGLIALRPNTIFRVDEYIAEDAPTDKVFMSLLKGALRSITGWVPKRNTGAYRITTPTATIGVRGTDHETTVLEGADEGEPGTYDQVNEGATVLRTADGDIDVPQGKFGFASRIRAGRPMLLNRNPGFFGRNHLKIEARIEQRKLYFKDHLDEIRNQRMERLKALKANKAMRLDEKLESRESRMEKKQQRADKEGLVEGKRQQRLENRRSKLEQRATQAHTRQERE